MSIKPACLILAVVATMFGQSVAAEGSHKHHFAKDIDAVHGVLAPLWHSPPGKDRAQKVCAQAERMEQLAHQIRSVASKPLVTSIATLRAQCQTNPVAIDQAFSDVHDAFHVIAEH